MEKKYWDVACNMRLFSYRYPIIRVISSVMLSSALIGTISINCTLCSAVLEAHLPVFLLSAGSLLSWSSVLSRCCPLRLFPFILTGPLLLRIPVNLTSVLRLSHWRRRFLLYWLAGPAAGCNFRVGKMSTIESDLYIYSLWVRLDCFVSSILNCYTA